MKKLLVVLSVLPMVGCMSMLPQPAKDKIVAGVKRYCVTPQGERQLIRSDINANLVGVAEVKVHCQGDIE